MGLNENNLSDENDKLMNNKTQQQEMLLIVNDTLYRGFSFGSLKSTSGELVFSTGNLFLNKF